jgi:hypothetical protein
MDIITENKNNTLVPSCVSLISELDITAKDKSLLDNLKIALEARWDDEKFSVLSTENGDWRLVNEALNK